MTTFLSKKKTDDDLIRLREEETYFDPYIPRPRWRISSRELEYFAGKTESTLSCFAFLACLAVHGRDTTHHLLLLPIVPALRRASLRVHSVRRWTSSSSGHRLEQPAIRVNYFFTRSDRAYLSHGRTVPGLVHKIPVL